MHSSIQHFMCYKKCLIISCLNIFPYNTCCINVHTCNGYHGYLHSPVPSAAEPTIYFMAIIDVLTLYNAKKKAAHAAKTVKHGVSAVGC